MSETIRDLQLESKRIRGDMGRAYIARRVTLTTREWVQESTQEIRAAIAESMMMNRRMVQP